LEGEHRSGSRAESLDSPRSGAGMGLQARWERLKTRIEALWMRLSVPAAVCEHMHSGPMSLASPHSLHHLERHLKELLEFEAATSRIISGWLQREALIEKVKGTHVLGYNDARLGHLRADFGRLDRLSVGLVRLVGTWCQRFGHLAVDATRLPVSRPLEPGQKLRAVFVWGGRDVVERIHSDADFLARGDLQQLGRGAVVRAAVGQAVLPDVDDPSLQLSASGAASASPLVEAPQTPLVLAAAVSRKPTVSEVLHEGPPPPWYSPQVARAGINALRRGQPCGGGERRL